MPVLFRCHAGLGQRAARGRKADHDLEPLSGADQIAHTGTGAQRILDFGECRASILVPHPRDHGGDGLGITGPVGKQKLVALSRIKHGVRMPAANGARNSATAARLKRMGVTPGFPDLVFFGPHCEVCFVELKAERGRLSEAQSAVMSHLRAAGHDYHCSSDYRDLVEVLKGWGVLRTGIHVQ